MLRFDNTASGITKLRKHLQEQDTTLAVCEPTGGSERLLTSQLRKTILRCTWSARAGCALSPKPAATRPRPIHWMPRYSPATGGVSGGGYVGTEGRPAA